MKLLVIVLIIGSTDISVDCYDFKQGEVSYSTNIIHPNPQHPDQEAQSAFSVNYGSSPNFAQQQKNSLYQIYRNQNQYSQPSQAFNVGYSVSFTNGVPSKPKQTFPDIVLGSHKEQVIKPNYASYTQNQLPGFEAKPTTTSWPTLGIGNGNGMFHSTNVNLDSANPVKHTSNVLNLEDASLPRSFDHAKALGGSQGFDYTDVLGVNPILQFNQKYNRQIPEGLKTAQTLNYPPVNKVPISMKDNVVSLGNLPGTNIVISDNLEAKFVPENVVKLQKQMNPNQEIVETFTASPTSYEDLNNKFRLDQPNFPLPSYQSPSSDLTPSYSQYSSQGPPSLSLSSDLTPLYSQYSPQGPPADLTPSYSQYSPQGSSSQGLTSDLTPSYSQYSPQYINHEVQRPDLSYDSVPQSQNQLYKNYRTYGQPHRYYSKNLDNSRIKHFNLKSKFARGVRASMQPPNHRTLPRRKRVHNTRQIN